jgi:Transglutaminase-like superfamily/Coenzyme PQQ synthesis protein D (PqqD)
VKTLSFRLRQAVRGLTLRAALPLMLKRRPLPELLASLDGAKTLGAAPGDDPHRQALRLFRPLRFWPTTCLYRALGSYALLRAAGQEVRFVIGVRKERGQLMAHAWLERDGRAIVGAPGPGESWAVAYAWPADPAMLAPAGGASSVSGIERSQDAVLTELQDGTGVLLHLQARFYFTLNATGVQVWKLLGDGAQDAAELARRLAAAFPGTDPDQVRADVDALLADLTRESLVTVRG